MNRALAGTVRGAGGGGGMRRRDAASDDAIMINTYGRAGGAARLGFEVTPMVRRLGLSVLGVRECVGNKEETVIPIGSLKCVIIHLCPPLGPPHLFVPTTVPHHSSQMVSSSWWTAT